MIYHEVNAVIPLIGLKLESMILTLVFFWGGFVWIAISGASLVAQTVKNLPAMRENGVQSLGQEGLLEKEMATHFSILAWRIPWT